MFSNYSQQKKKSTVCAFETRADLAGTGWKKPRWNKGAWRFSWAAARVDPVGQKQGKCNHFGSAGKLARGVDLEMHQQVAHRLLKDQILPQAVPSVCFHILQLGGGDGVGWRSLRRLLASTQLWPCQSRS